jgi:VanZ family protein
MANPPAAPTPTAAPGLIAVLWVAALLACVAVTIVLLVPGKAMGHAPGRGTDKLAHGLAFAVIAAPAAAALRLRRRAWSRVATVTTILVGVGLFHGGVTEALQAVIPGRTSEFADLVANLAGATVGAGLGVAATDLRRVLLALTTRADET